jgi:hypothetical protein
VTLSASDTGSANGTGSGVAKVYYSVDSAACAPVATGSCLTYTAPFSINTPGAHTVRYFSLDKAGNVEATETVTFTEK